MLIKLCNLLFSCCRRKDGGGVTKNQVVQQQATMKQIAAAHLHSPLAPQLRLRHTAQQLDTSSSGSRTPTPPPPMPRFRTQPPSPPTLDWSPDQSLSTQTANVEYRKNDDLARIMTETDQVIRQSHRSYKSHSGNIVTLPNQGLRQVQQFSLDTHRRLKKWSQTRVTVENSNCLNVAERCVRQTKKTLLLDMANADTPGGGARKGARAQEETICRASSLLSALEDARDRNLYARRFLHGPNGIYVPKVAVFRDSENNYQFMDEPFEVAVAAIAAIRKYNQGDLLTPNEKELTKNKIRALFQKAYDEGIECLVLGALGCGAFHNPPREIAQIFQEVIKEFDGCFREVVFAVIDDHNSNGNFATFQRQFTRE